MAITTHDGFVGSAKQPFSFGKTASRTAVAAQWFSVFDIAGNPGAGVLAGTSTTTGVVPTDATAGCPTINAFGGGATGYLMQIEYGSSVACRIKLFDLLWKGGAYAFNANTTGQTPTSFSSRVPGGTVSSTTGTVAAPAAMIVGRCFQLPLAAGDTGVQGVTGVVGSVATAGTFNILVVRPIWSGRVKIANDGDVHDYAKTGMPLIYVNSALMMLVAPDSTATGIPELELVIANG